MQENTEKNGDPILRFRVANRRTNGRTDGQTEPNL